MSLAEKAIAMLTVLRPEDVHALPPAQRQQLANLCRHLAGIADPKPLPKIGVLSDLHNGERAL